MRFLYAVMPCGEPMENVNGLSGEPLSHTDARGLRIVSEECGAVPAATKSALLSFGESVQRICRNRRALPFRFGTALPSEAAVIAVLEARCAEWQRRLEAIRGLSEFIVHAGSNHAAAADRTSGTAYLQGLAEEAKRARDLTEALTSAIGEVCRGVRPLQAAAGQVRVACLLAPESSRLLEARTLAVSKAHPGTEIQLTGPWPPFSFAMEPPSP